MVGAALAILAAACADGRVGGPDPLAPNPQTPILRQGAAKPASAAAAAAANGGLVTKDLTQGTTAADLASALVGIGGGITISNVQYTGADSAAGTFSGGDGIIGFDTGIILSTGVIRNVVGPNTDNDITGNNATPGDAALTELAGHETYDAAILSFDFVPSSSKVSFEYVFASDEYNEYVGSQFNDVFAFYINGKNCAVVGDPAVPVSINTINAGYLGTPPSNANLYINNDPFDGTASGVTKPVQKLDTEMDGLTVVLKCEAAVNPGVKNTMRLAIADASDDSYDSNVFIKAQSLVSNQPPTATITAPSNGSSWAQGASIDFAGSANDPEQGALSGSSLVWTSSRDGQIGTGTSFNTSDLSVGQHTITLTATDAEGATGTASVTITVTPAAGNEPPTAVISSPTTGAEFTAGAAVGFKGGGTDPEDGALSGSSLVWRSNLDGQIGTGTSFSLSTLSVGVHTITLTATDSKGAQGTATVSLTITGGEEPPPSDTLAVTIDILPGVSPNVLDLMSGHTLQPAVPVALFSTADFDATKADVASLRLGSAAGVGASVVQSEAGTYLVESRDVNGDGRKDLVATFCLCSLAELKLVEAGTTELLLWGTLSGGQAFLGRDSVEVWR